MGDSRVEDILQATLDSSSYDGRPQSRVEYLLKELNDLIEGGGGGGGAIRPGGSILFEELPEPSEETLGFLYDISDSFTTTSDFKEGAGKSYPAGTNVMIIDAGTAGNPVYMYDCMSGFVDLSNYVQKESGKGLSSNDYTTTEKEKLAGLSNYDDTALSGRVTAVETALDGHTVATDVPSNAVFTDTVYDDTALSSRVSAVEGVVPSTATTANKLATASDVAGEDISASASGESISITDAANARVQELKIYGKSELSQGSIVSLGDSGFTVTCGGVTADIGSGTAIRGVPVTAGRDHNYTDGNGQNWMADIFSSNGKKIAYTAVIDLGDLTWTRQNGSGSRYFVAAPEIPIKRLPGSQQNQIVYDLICTDGYTSDTGRNIYYGTTDKTISLGGGVIAAYNSAYVGDTADNFKTAVTGVKLLYIVETPISTDISDKDRAALRKLRTSTGTTAVTNTEDAYMDISYLKNTNNGKAIANLQDYGIVKSFTYVGTGSTTNKITFPERPSIILSIFGEHTFSSNTWSVSSRSFAWGVRTIWVDWIAVGGTTNGQQICPATYDGTEVTFTGPQSDPGASLNAENSVYTVIYI